MNALVLYGLNCTLNVWDQIKDQLSDLKAEYVAYPHEITQTAESVEDLSRWVNQNYNKEKYDVLIGHSMGGIIALQLAVLYNWQCERILLIETNLRPANAFYRNLLLESNMEKYGDRVMKMLQNEAPYYTKELQKQLQEDFDYSRYIHQTTAKVFGIYGDRGKPDYPQRITDFCLEEDTADQMIFSFIPNSCHMPMLENAEACASAVKECLCKIE